MFWYRWPALLGLVWYLLFIFWEVVLRWHIYLERVYVCTWACVSRTHVTCSPFPFHCVGPTCHTQVTIGLGGNHLYPLSHLASPLLNLIKSIYLLRITFVPRLFHIFLIFEIKIWLHNFPSSLPSFQPSHIPSRVPPIPPHPTSRAFSQIHGSHLFYFFFSLILKGGLGIDNTGSEKKNITKMKQLFYFILF